MDGRWRAKKSRDSGLIVLCDSSSSVIGYQYSVSSLNWATARNHRDARWLETRRERLKMRNQISNTRKWRANSWRGLCESDAGRRCSRARHQAAVSDFLHPHTVFSRSAGHHVQPTDCLARRLFGCLQVSKTQCMHSWQEIRAGGVAATVAASSRSITNSYTHGGPESRYPFLTEVHSTTAVREMSQNYTEHGKTIPLERSRTSRSDLRCY